jgi:hypothetical protein
MTFTIILLYIQFALTGNGNGKYSNGISTKGATMDSGTTKRMIDFFWLWLGGEPQAEELGDFDMPGGLRPRTLMGCSEAMVA